MSVGIPAQAQDFDVFINGVSVKNFVDSLGWARDSLSFTQGEILHWRGQLVLSKALDPEGQYNIDDRTNPNLKKGALVEIYVRRGSSLFLERTLRIKKAFYDESTQSTTIELIDILELLSFRSDAETDLDDKESSIRDCNAILGNIFNTTYSTAATNLLIKAGIDPAKINLPTTAGQIIDFFIDKGTESYVTIAAKLLFTQLLFLEVRADETVIANAWPQPPGNPLFSRNRRDLISLQRVQNPEDYFSLVKASSNRKKVLAVDPKTRRSVFYETIDSSSFNEASKTVITGSQTIYLCPSPAVLTVVGLITSKGRPYRVNPVPNVTAARSEVFNYSAFDSITGRLLSQEESREITNYTRASPQESGRKTSRSSTFQVANYNSQGFMTYEEVLTQKSAVTEGTVKAKAEVAAPINRSSTPLIPSNLAWGRGTK